MLPYLTEVRIPLTRNETKNALSERAVIYLHAVKTVKAKNLASCVPPPPGPGFFFRSFVRSASSRGLEKLGKKRDHFGGVGGGYGESELRTFWWGGGGGGGERKK